MTNQFIQIFKENVIDNEVKLGTAGIRLTDIVTLKRVAVRICIYCLKYSNISGLMITASHNPANFNGLKLVINEGDLMSSDEEEELNAFINGNWVDFKNNRCDIYIARDTRSSGKVISEYLSYTFQNTNIKIVDLGIVHTPYLYWFIEKCNRNKFIDYYEEIKENFYKTEWDNCFKYPFIVDCANGSMGKAKKILKHIFDEKGLNYMFINFEDNTDNINNQCGSDFCWNKKEIKIWNKEGDLTGVVKGFTFDGDGDRILFFNGEIIGDKVKVSNIYSGDHLICFYSALLSKFDNSGLVFTPYSNFGMIDYIRKRDIPYSICAPGVKNLIKTSHKYKISCIFEYNGHGNIEWNKDLVYDKSIQPYLNLLYSKAGDVIGHCLIILNDFLSGYDFDFFDILPQYHGCIKVKNMELFKTIKTNELETEIIYPENLANELKNIYSTRDNRVVVRPSGTEPIFRVMIEGENGEELFKEIERKIEF